MRFEKFTTKLQEAFAEAQSAAVGQDHQYIEPQHLLLALLEDEGVAGLVAKAGGNPQAIKKSLADAVARLPKVEGTPGEVHVSRELAQLLNVADKEAQKRGDQYIASELVVLAAASILKIGKGALEKAIEQIRGGEKVTGQADESQRQALAKYTLGSDRKSKAGKARPGDRPRRRDPALHPDPAAAHQEQPGADRRAGRRQDGDRRRPGAAHRQRRGARIAEEQAAAQPRHGVAARRREIPRRVRGAAEDRC